MTPLTAVKKPRALTEEEIIALIREGQQGMSLRQYAKHIRITPSTLSDIYLGRRSPGEKVLKLFGDKFGLDIRKRRRVIVEYTFTRK